MMHSVQNLDWSDWRNISSNEIELFICYDKFRNQEGCLTSMQFNDD